ncbi:stAR-related lipid transfer protein 3-like isoform X2 [Antedon mediterranea]|uniref:stAR-related lipid transfer protein 3-like isoform X2 n=1 Tax=Antedon mediterranea TaxID=105859 RepID=UPI003AF58FCB
MVQYSMSAYNRNSTARHAAEILISGSTEQIKGVKSTIQPFSSVRRMFCLFVTFDMLFMGILWILYLNTSGIGDLKKAFDCQVNHFTIKTSMFDVVLLTAGRVICLLLAYALIRSNHWFTVAFTTSVTCIFLVMKIVYYFGSSKSLKHECTPDSDAQVMEYIIFLSCFVSAWIEVWILDLKVLPKERKWKEGNSRILHSATQNERTALLHPELNQDSIPDQPFYSPIDSPRGSDDESGGYGSYRSRIDDFQSLPNSQRGSSINLASSAEDQAYLQKAKEAHIQIQSILSETEGWKTERKKNNIQVTSRYFKGITGKVYKLEATINASVQEIFNVLWNGIDDTVKWNTTVIECRLLHSITSSADIVYSVAAEGAGGVISSSGENGPGGWVAEPIDENPDISRFIWILNTDLKFMVWTPQTVLDTALSVVVMNIFFGLRGHIEKQKKRISNTTFSTENHNLPIEL